VYQRRDCEYTHTAQCESERDTHQEAHAKPVEDEGSEEKGVRTARGHETIPYGLDERSQGCRLRLAHVECLLGTCSLHADRNGTTDHTEAESVQDVDVCKTGDEEADKVEDPDIPYRQVVELTVSISRQRHRLPPHAHGSTSAASARADRSTSRSIPIGT
jgi:hypothetical protein